MRLQLFFLLSIFTLCDAVNSSVAAGHRPSKLPFYKKCLVIYDNDDHRDVYTDEYLLALSSLEEIDLRGIITTYSAREYPVFVRGRESIMNLAMQSGLKNLPLLCRGTSEKLICPPGNHLDHTAPLDIDGSRLIVKVAAEATKRKPLIIIAGGQLTTIANAYLIDPSIAGKVVVAGIFGAERLDYNAALDSWAWTIILSRFQVVAFPIGPPGNRSAVYMKPPVVPKERIQTVLDQNIPLFRWMYGKKHPSNELPDERDFDGHPAILLTQPGYVTAWKRFECKGINDRGYPVLRESPEGGIWLAIDADQDLATKEFWRVMTKLNSSLKKAR